MLTDSAWGSLAGMILVVVIVIGGAYWFTRYVVGGRNFRSFGLSQQRREQLQVLAQTRLGKDQFLTVVQAGPKYLLLGVTPQSISMLAELSQEEAALWLPGPDEGERNETPNFKQAFLTTLQQRKKR